jgi:uncharacterized membrane protein
MAVAQATGTVQFLAIGLIVIGVWFGVNGVVTCARHALYALFHGKKFDPAPWILLSLVFSFEAFFTGSLVIIATRASAVCDSAREEADAKASRGTRAEPDEAATGEHGPHRQDPHLTDAADFA